MGVTAERSVDTGLDTLFRDNLCTAGNDDDLITDTLFDSQVIDPLHVLVVDVVMGNDGGSEDRFSVHFDGSVNQLLNRYGGAEVVDFNAPLLDAAVLDVDDLAQAYGVLVFTDGTADDDQRMRFDVITEFLVGEVMRFRRNDQIVNVDVEVDLALHFDTGTFSFLHDFAGDDFRIDEAEFLTDLDSDDFGGTAVSRDHHGDHDGAVSRPFHLGLDQVGVTILPCLFQSGVDVVLVEFVDEDDLAAVFEGAAADQCGRVLGVAAVLLNVVVAEVCSDRSHVVLISLVDEAVADTTVDLTGNTVTVTSRVFSGVDEEAFFDSLEVTTDFEDLFHEQGRLFADLSGLLDQMAFLLQFDHIHQTVHTDQSLLCSVASFDVVDVPRNVTAFIRCDGGLDIRAGQLGDHHVHDMGNSRFTSGGVDVLGVHLRSHAVFAQEVTQCDSVRQIVVDARCRCSRRRYCGQADVFGFDAAQFGELGVDSVLDDQFRHDFPCITSCCVRVVRTVDLSHVSPCQDGLGLAGVDEGTDAVDVSVQYVVLGILVNTVDAFFSEHDSDVRTSNAGYVGMVVDRTANFILDQVDGFSLCTDNLTGDRDTTDTLGGTFDQTIHVGLAGSTNDHEVVSAVPCSHSHTTDIVFETAGCDLGGDNGQRLRVRAFKILRRRKRNTLLERFGSISVSERSDLDARCRGSPGPAFSSGFIFIEVLQEFFDVQFFILLQRFHPYFPPLNSAATSSHPSPLASMMLASRMDISFALANL